MVFERGKKFLRVSLFRESGGIFHAGRGRVEKTEVLREAEVLLISAFARNVEKKHKKDSRTIPSIAEIRGAAHGFALEPPECRGWQAVLASSKGEKEISDQTSVWSLIFCFPNSALAKC